MLISHLQSSVASIEGLEFALDLRGKTPGQRAALAAKLVRGELVLDGLTQGQAAAITSSTKPSVSAACRATRADRQWLEAGQLGLGALRRQPPTDVEIERVIRRLGPERVWRALTAFNRNRPAPTPFTAAE